VKGSTHVLLLVGTVGRRNPAHAHAQSAQCHVPCTQRLSDTLSPPPPRRHLAPRPQRRPESGRAARRVARGIRRSTAVRQVRSQARARGRPGERTGVMSRKGDTGRMRLASVGPMPHPVPPSTARPRPPASSPRAGTSRRRRRRRQLPTRRRAAGRSGAPPRCRP